MTEDDGSAYMWYRHISTVAVFDCMLCTPFSSALSLSSPFFSGQAIVRAFLSHVSMKLSLSLSVKLANLFSIHIKTYELFIIFVSNIFSCHFSHLVSLFLVRLASHAPLCWLAITRKCLHFAAQITYCHSNNRFVYFNIIRLFFLSAVCSSVLLCSIQCITFE